MAEKPAFGTNLADCMQYLGMELVGVKKRLVGVKKRVVTWIPTKILPK
jgi:hypothetical protein